MDVKATETGAQPSETVSSKPITVLKKLITEIPAYADGITLRGENIGTKDWAKMLEVTLESGDETMMTVYQNIFTKKYLNGPMVTGKGGGFKNGEEEEIPMSDIGATKSLFYDGIATVHTHPIDPEHSHIKTSVPSGKDLIYFLNTTYSCMVVLDRGGAHLLIRTGRSMATNPPPADIVQKKIDEVDAKGGVIRDVQKSLNGLFYQYGINYFYTENLTPLENGTITFRKPV